MELWQLEANKEFDEKFKDNLDKRVSTTNNLDQIILQVKNLNATERSLLALTLISISPEEELDAYIRRIYLHVILYQMQIRDPDQRRKIVNLTDSRYEHFHSADQNEHISKIKQLILEYENLLRAESIINTLEKETR